MEDIKRRYFIFRCKCCGSTFDVRVSNIFMKETATLNDVNNNMCKIHICSETGLLGVAEVIGMTNNGVETEKVIL